MAKRKAIDDITDTTTRRQSRRVEKAKVNYQESDGEDVASGDDFKEDEDVSEPESIHEDASAVDEEDFDAASEDDNDDDELDDFEKDLKKKGYKRVKGKGGKWEMVIEMPKAKDDGGIPYEDKRIHPNTLSFLKDLKKNNDREWMKFHDPIFRQAEKDFYGLVGELTPIVSEKDSTIPELPTKDLIYRIYRDVRFSPDKTPYKTYFAVTWSRTGRKGPYAHYYLQIQPGGLSRFGGGYHGSDNLTINCLREDIDQQPHQFKSILMGERLRKTFFPNVPTDEKKIVEAFCKMNADNALKKKPKDYAADHKDIGLLKLRNYIIRRMIPDEEIIGKDALSMLGDYIEAIEPFITYLNGVVMPDN